MNALKLTLSLLLLTGPMLLAEPTPVIAPGASDAAITSPPKTIDLLAEALPVLQQQYVDFPSLNYQKGDQLNDLISRSGGEINLEPSEPQAGTERVRSALLPDNVIYYRLSTFTFKQGWKPIVTELNQWIQQGATGLIFDVRSNTDPNDYTGVRDIASLVMPEKTLVLSTQGLPNPPGYTEGRSENGSYATGQDFPPFQGPVIVLTDKQTTGAGEVLAAYLKQYRGALVIGQTTRGREAVFGWQDLPSGQIISYAIAHVLLPDGTDLWKHPVVPDIEMAINDHNEKSALTLIRNDQILDLIGESPQRHTMSEAALIQGVDPEWDSYLAGLEKKPFLLSLPIVHDDVLISALDCVKAIRASQKRPDPTIQASVQPSTATTVQ